MYKVKDYVIYNGRKCFIGQVLGGGRYTVIECSENPFVIEVYTKDLDPYFAPGDKVSLVGELKGDSLKQHFSNIDINNMEVLANCNGDVLIKGTGIYTPSSMFKYASKPRHTIRYTVYDNVSGKTLETFDNEKDAIEKCEALNKVSINTGDIFKHSDGTAVEVVNSTIEETEVMLEIAGSVYYSKYDNQQFLKEFTK